MKKLNTKAFTLIILAIVILGLFYYTYLNDNAGNNKNTTSSSEVEKLLNYDFEEDYPKTVRETVKLHNSFLKNALNGNFSEDELVTVNKNIRQLFDQELLDYNSETDQLNGLVSEVELYKEEKKKIASFSLAEGSQVQYNTEGEEEYAKTRVTLLINVSGYTVSADQEYILHKDEDGRWKILGWQAVNGKDSSSTEN